MVKILENKRNTRVRAKLRGDKKVMGVVGGMWPWILCACVCCFINVYG